MKLLKKRVRLGAVLLWACVVACAAASADSVPGGDKSARKKKLVCWIEASGHRACGDAVPLRYAGQELHILDQAGRTVKVIPGALTQEQRAAREASARQAAAARRETEQQAAHDRALLATYSAPGELAALRDDRLSSLDTSIHLSEVAAKRDADALQELRARIPAGGAKPTPRLAESIAKFEASKTSNTRAADDLRRNRATVCANFARDIRRFQELKSGSVSFDSPCPSPGSFAAVRADAPDLASARNFFDGLAELERDFDPSRFNLYASTALIKRHRVDARGQVQWIALPFKKHRVDSLKNLASDKARLQTFSYSDVKLESEIQGRVRVSGVRTPDRGGKPAPFQLLLKPSGKSWVIVEEVL